MSESKFTKGEWKISDGYRVGVEVSFGDGFFNIATCQIFNEAKANAHLIAAAPEMYEMLQELYETLGDEYSEDLDKIEILLAKARGEK